MIYLALLNVFYSLKFDILQIVRLLIISIFNLLKYEIVIQTLAISWQQMKIEYVMWTKVYYVLLYKIVMGQ